jgi:hypothetical protein
MPSIYELAADVDDRLAHLDTVSYFARYLPRGSRSELQRHYRNRIRIDPVRARHGTWSPGATITAQLPSPDLLDAMDQYGHPSRLDVALELITADPKALWDMLCRVLRLRYHPKLKPWKHPDGNVAYIGKRRDNRVIAIYWDRPSKLTGHRCLRLELRLRRRAIRDQHLDPRGCNPVALLDHNVCMRNAYGDTADLPRALVPDHLTWPLQRRANPPTTPWLRRRHHSPTQQPPAHLSPILPLLRRSASPQMQPLQPRRDPSPAPLLRQRRSP